nr:unnamed protein product [Callosobruchus chinensis]
MANINYSNKLDVLKICHLNVRSVSAAFDYFCDLVENKFDVICITETWLNDNIPNHAVSIEGYRLLRKDRLGRGGGVGFYIRNSINFEVLNTLDFSRDIPLELLCCKLRLNHSSFLIVVIYRPPHTPINASVGIVDDMLSFFSPQYDNILILGDINIDLFNHENPLSNCLDSFNFTQLINEPTRVTLHSSTLLDPIFTNTPK